MTTHRLHVLSIMLSLPLIIYGHAASAAELRVIATIKPIHSLVASVMAGVGTPDLLIKGANSPHKISLKPSDARSLSKADIVFWLGENIEVFLTKPLKTLATSATVIDLSQTAGLQKLATREADAWESHDHEDNEEHSNYDPHFWLNPANAQAVVNEIISRLSSADAQHATQYATNGAALILKLNALTAELNATLAPIKSQPYIVFHDAYQYFESRFKLNAVGAITLNPEHSSGAKRLTKIREKIASLKVKCVFSEPQFKPAIIKSLIHNTPAKLGILDPLGVDISAGPSAYIMLMRSLAKGLVSCLEGSE